MFSCATDICCSVVRAKFAFICDVKYVVNFSVSYMLFSCECHICCSVVNVIHTCCSDFICFVVVVENFVYLNIYFVSTKVLICQSLT